MSHSLPQTGPTVDSGIRIGEYTELSEYFDTSCRSPRPVGELVEPTIPKRRFDKLSNHRLGSPVGEPVEPQRPISHRDSKNQFQVNDIQPSPEFKADLGEAGDLPEAKTFVEPHAGGVLRRDTGDQRMESPDAAFFD